MGEAVRTRTIVLNRQVLGMLCVAAGVSIFSLHDAIVKGLSDTLPVHQIVFVRSVVAFPILLCIAFAEGSGRLTLRRWRLHALRGLIMYVSFTTYYLALARLLLAENTTLFFSAPLFVAALSVPILTERVERGSWAAIGIGFIGVLIVLRPGFEVVDVTALLPVLAAAAYAVSALLARRLGSTEGAGAMGLSATAVYILASAATGLALAGFEPPEGAHSSVRFLLSHWIWPYAAKMTLLVVCGLISAFVFFLLALGYRLARANRVAPFEYAALPWSVLWGFLFFGNIPDGATLVGAAVIIGCGLYMVQGERTARKEPSS